MRKAHQQQHIDQPSQADVRALAPSGAGKSCINGPVRAIISDILKADKVNRAKRDAWIDAARTASKNGKQPSKPKVPIRILSADTTSARLYDAAQDAKGWLILFFTPELEKLKKLTNNNIEALHALIETSADFNAIGGQERVSADAAQTNTNPELCIIASTTPSKCRKFFAGQEATGSRARAFYATIVKRGNDIAPSVDTRGMIECIKPWITNLNDCHDVVLTPSAKDVVDDELQGMNVAECARLRKLSQKLYEELLEMIDRTDDSVIATLATRCQEHAYWAICVLYIANGMKWEKSFEDFARWMTLYDMWVQYRLFGEKIRMALRADDLFSATPVVNSADGIFESLPEVFTKEDVRRAYIMAGLTPKAAMDVMRQWKRRGRIEDLGNGTFRKVEAKKKAKHQMA